MGCRFFVWTDLKIEDVVFEGVEYGIEQLQVPWQDGMRHNCSAPNILRFHLLANLTRGGRGCGDGVETR